jgi:hypothetical protein
MVDFQVFGKLNILVFTVFVRVRVQLNNKPFYNIWYCYIGIFHCPVRFHNDEHDAFTNGRS